MHLSLNLAKIFLGSIFLRGVTTFLESFHKSFINLRGKFSLFTIHSGELHAPICMSCRPGHHINSGRQMSHIK